MVPGSTKERGRRTFELYHVGEHRLTVRSRYCAPSISFCFALTTKTCARPKALKVWIKRPKTRAFERDESQDESQDGSKGDESPSETNLGPVRPGVPSGVEDVEIRRKR